MTHHLYSGRSHAKACNLYSRKVFIAMGDSALIMKCCAFLITNRWTLYSNFIIFRYYTETTQRNTMHIHCPHPSSQSFNLSIHRSGGSKISNDKNSAVLDVGQRRLYGEHHSNQECNMVSTGIMTVHETSVCGINLPSDSSLFYTELQELNV